MKYENKLSGLSCPYCGKELYIDFDICPYCGRTVPDTLLHIIQTKHGTIGTKTIEDEKSTKRPSSNILRLTHFDELEEESKTKIGTFERLHMEYMSKTSTYDFEDSDYAPLVNLLGSVMELELSRTLYMKLLPYWKQIANFANLNDIPKSKDCTLGTICLLIQKSENVKKSMRTPTIPREVKDSYEFIHKNMGDKFNEFQSQLEFITYIRNDADHKKVISCSKFNDFFTEYHEFYEKYIPILLQLKKMRGSYGYWMFIDMRKDFPIFKNTNYITS